MGAAEAGSVRSDPMTLLLIVLPAGLAVVCGAAAAVLTALRLGWP